MASVILSQKMHRRRLPDFCQYKNSHSKASNRRYSNWFYFLYSWRQFSIDSTNPSVVLWEMTEFSKAIVKSAPRCTMWSTALRTHLEVHVQAPGIHKHTSHMQQITKNRKTIYAVAFFVFQRALLNIVQYKCKKHKGIPRVEYVSHLIQPPHQDFSCPSPTI